jgi:hypothetical protein
MEAYKVIKPANLQELDAALRINPFGSGFPIIIEEDFGNNDIAKRRGVVPKREEATFLAVSIDVGKSSENARTMITMGEVAIKGVVFTGRISASEKGDDGDDNFPELLIV